MLWLQFWSKCHSILQDRPSKLKHLTPSYPHCCRLACAEDHPQVEASLVYALPITVVALKCISPTIIETSAVEQGSRIATHYPTPTAAAAGVAAFATGRVQPVSTPILSSLPRSSSLTSTIRLTAECVAFPYLRSLTFGECQPSIF